MALSLLAMTPELASEINAWRYAAPYDTYNADSPADLLGGDDLAVLDDAELVGFACFGVAARVPGGPPAEDGVTDLGYGIRPDLVSGRLGTRAVALVIEALRMAGHLRLRVCIMDWNERSLRLSKGLGFVEVSSFADERDGRRFVVLVRDLD